ncbi:hypothetical protein AB0346_28860 [Nocardia beijingensis]|uniref:hypothetical protein n=1 Tax=Nocardia beijingensis TaxID=95162 RepID=UPI0008326578|nr:hypothetical protein [Nocardia beijingensis]
MRISTVVVATTVAVAFTVVAGSAGATPDSPDAVGFTATAVGDRSVIETDAGSLAVDNDMFEVKAADGTVLAATPLRFRVDEFEFPISAEVAGRTATLTPRFDLEHAVYAPVALPYEDKAPWKNEYDREQAAWSRMTSTITMGATLGTLIGGLGGGAVGCVLGGIAGATIAAATIAGLFGPFIPAAAVGCLGGIVAVGALGTIAGQLFVTAPIAAVAVIQYLSTVNSPLPGK